MTRFIRSRDWPTICLLIVIGCSVLAALTVQPGGGDYFFDSGSIDALVRGDLDGFFAEQPLTGPLSLLLRAPFVALVFDSSLTTVYLIGVIPCYAALLVLARVLWVRMEARPLKERVAMVVVCAGSPLAVRAVHWGHPEEFLGAALAVGAVLAAGRDRAVAAGVLLGLAFATKQWALLAAAPALAALASRRVLFIAVSAGVGAAFTLPMLIGDPDRFWLITEAAGSADPSATLGLRQGPFPQGHVAPHALWLPLGAEQTIAGRSYHFMDPTLAKLTHPLILLIGLPLAALLYRRAGGPLSPIAAMRLLALVFLLRCALDPNDLDYYHVPFMAALAAVAALGDRRDVVGALAIGAGLSLAFAKPADNLSDLTDQAELMWVLYMATCVPAGVWLWRRAQPARAPVQGGAGEARPAAARSGR